MITASIPSVLVPERIFGASRTKGKDRFAHVHTLHKKVRRSDNASLSPGHPVLREPLV
ncbi:MAG: hypothetical protein ACO1OK_07805 [Devosia sp.]